MGEAKRKKQSGVYRIPYKDYERLKAFTELKDNRVPTAPCLNCGAVLDGAWTDSDTKPYPGALGICFKCHHFMVYDANMQFRELTDEEVVMIAGEPKLLEAMGILTAFDKWKTGRYNVKVDHLTDDSDSNSS